MMTAIPSSRLLSLSALGSSRAAAVLLAATQPPPPGAATQPPAAAAPRSSGTAAAPMCCSSSSYSSCQPPAGVLGGQRGPWLTSFSNTWQQARAWRHLSGPWRGQHTATHHKTASSSGVQDATLAKEQQQPESVFRPGMLLAGGRYKLVEQQPKPQAVDASGSVAHDPRPALSIWRGQDTATDTPVHVKCFEAGDAATYAAGVREAAVWAAAGRHPNLRALLDAFEHRSAAGRHAVLVAQALDGTPLAEVAHKYKRGLVMSLNGIRLLRNLGEPDALRHVARQLLVALDHLHTRGLVHMNISVKSLMLDRRFESGDQMLVNALGLSTFLWKAVVTDSLTEQDQKDVLRAADSANVCHESTFTGATILLSDMSHAVPYTTLLPGLPAAASTAAGPEVTQLMRGLMTGLVAPPGSHVLHDGMQWTWRPPEELLGMAYAAPPYDMWQLGCLLYNLATLRDVFGRATVLFNKKQLLKNQAERESLRMILDPYSAEEFLLYAQTEVLGAVPRDLARRSPLFESFFIGSGSSYVLADTLRMTNVFTWKPGSRPLEIENMDSSQEAAACADFLSQLLTWDPAKRPSAQEMLQHRWLLTKQQA